VSNDQRTVAVGTLIASGGCVVRWLTQGVGDDRWLVFALMAAAIGVAVFVRLGRKK
jgi:hypothetical protein